MITASRALLVSAVVAGMMCFVPREAAGQGGAAGLRGTIKVDGSSTVYPITEAVAEEFRKVAPGVNVTVGISGTGGGFKRFCAGETDISNASRPIRKEEHEAAAAGRVEYIEVPVAFDGLSIVVNPRNTWVDHLTLEEVRRIFVDGSGVRTWRDVRPSWPDSTIRVFAPGTDSGTFDYFKEVVVGHSGSMRGDMSVSEDDNVLVKGVAGDENAIGFFGCAYYFENRSSLRVVPIDGGAGPVEPTHETIESGAYAPFSRPLFIYVNRKSVERPEVRAFLNFYLQSAGKLADEVGYVRLPNEVYSRGARNINARRTGSQYLAPDGAHRHGPVTEIYQ